MSSASKFFSSKGENQAAIHSRCFLSAASKRAKSSEIVFSLLLEHVTAKPSFNASAIACDGRSRRLTPAANRLTEWYSSVWFVMHPTPQSFSA